MDESIDWCSFLECMSSGQWLKSCPRALPKRTMHVYFLWRGPGHWNKRGVPNWISKSSMPTFTDQSTFSCVFSMFKSVHPGFFLVPRSTATFRCLVSRSINVPARGQSGAMCDLGNPGNQGSIELFRQWISLQHTLIKMFMPWCEKICASGSDDTCIMIIYV